MLNVAYILEALRHNLIRSNILSCQDSYLDEEERTPYRTTAYLFLLLFLLLLFFFFTTTGRNVKRVIYPRSAEAQLYHAMTSTWMNQKGYRTTASFFLRDEMVNVPFLEALRLNRPCHGFRHHLDESNV